MMTASATRMQALGRGDRASNACALQSSLAVLMEFPGGKGVKQHHRRHPSIHQHLSSEHFESSGRLGDL
eukprot:11190799-Lingulodinium_polyedra.AAC.1